MRCLVSLIVFRNVSEQRFRKIVLVISIYWRLALYGRDRFRRSGLRCLWSRPMLTPCLRRTEMFCSTRLANIPTKHRKDIRFKQRFPTMFLKPTKHHTELLNQVCLIKKIMCSFGRVQEHGWEPLD